VVGPPLRLPLRGALFCGWMRLEADTTRRVLRPPRALGAGEASSTGWACVGECRVMVVMVTGMAQQNA